MSIEVRRIQDAAISSERTATDFIELDNLSNGAVNLNISKDKNCMPSTQLIQIDILQKILNNQNQLLSHVLYVKKGLRKLTTESKKFKSKLTFDKESLPAQESALVPELWKFNKIDTEQDFINFENKIEADVSFKNECIVKLKEFVGSMAQTTSYDCALRLDRIIFTNNFWTSTAWTGGRSKMKKRKSKSIESALDQGTEIDYMINVTAEENLEESSNNTKFAFSTHQRFIEFFKQLILHINGSIPTDEDLKKFVQCRSRNAFYNPKTDRLPAKRVKQQKTVIDLCK